jgi:hypothetical protein
MTLIHYDPYRFYFPVQNVSGRIIETGEYFEWPSTGEVKLDAVDEASFTWWAGQADEDIPPNHYGLLRIYSLKLLRDEKSKELPHRHEALKGSGV